MVTYSRASARVQTTYRGRIGSGCFRDERARNCASARPHHAVRILALRERTRNPGKPTHEQKIILYSGDIKMLDAEECARLRNFAPRNAHEHALLAQLPEFYSPTPSRDKLRSIAERVLSSTEEQNRSVGRAVVAELCPTVAPVSLLLSATIAIAILASVYAFLRYFAPTGRSVSRGLSAV
jgi:hypothetical protein